MTDIAYRGSQFSDSILVTVGDSTVLAPLAVVPRSKGVPPELQLSASILTDVFGIVEIASATIERFHLDMLVWRLTDEWELTRDEVLDWADSCAPDLLNAPPTIPKRIIGASEHGVFSYSDILTTKAYGVPLVSGSRAVTVSEAHDAYCRLTVRPIMSGIMDGTITLSAFQAQALIDRLSAFVDDVERQYPSQSYERGTSHSRTTGRRRLAGRMSVEPS